MVLVRHGTGQPWYWSDMVLVSPFHSSIPPPPQAKSWVTEKMQVANDESYKDPTNLENKIQKHQEFDAEIIANEQRIGSIAQVSDVM